MFFYLSVAQLNIVTAIINLGKRSICSGERTVKYMFNTSRTYMTYKSKEIC